MILVIERMINRMEKERKCGRMGLNMKGIIVMERNKMTGY